jgi:hypothetical protein
MASKSNTIDIPHDDLKSAFDTLSRLGLIAGPDATVDLDGTIHILPATADRLVEAHIHNRADPAPPPTLTAPPRPRRQDRRIILPPWAENKLLQLHRAFLALANDAGDDIQAIRKAQCQWQHSRCRLRKAIIHDYAQADVVHGNTYCYGADLDGAHRLDQPTGEVIRCDRLIHYTHPVSPEDLALREARVWCVEVYRYHIPGLDDAQWQAQNEPLQPLTPDSYRELLVACRSQD